MSRSISVATHKFEKLWIWPVCACLVLKIAAMHEYSVLVHVTQANNVIIIIIIIIIIIRENTVVLLLLFLLL